MPIFFTLDVERPRNSNDIKLINYLCMTILTEGVTEKAAGGAGDGNRTHGSSLGS